MGRNHPPAAPRAPDPADARAARLKAALKANIARRKAQAKARSSGPDSGAGPEPGAGQVRRDTSE